MIVAATEPSVPRSSDSRSPRLPRRGHRRRHAVVGEAHMSGSAEYIGEFEGHGEAAGRVQDGALVRCGKRGTCGNVELHTAHATIRTPTVSARARLVVVQVEVRDEGKESTQHSPVRSYTLRDKAPPLAPSILHCSPFRQVAASGKSTARERVYSPWCRQHGLASWSPLHTGVPVAITQ